MPDQYAILAPESVAVIIVNWCNIPDTLVCLESVAGLIHRPLACLVVENGSGEYEGRQLADAWWKLWKKYEKKQPIMCHAGEVLSEGQDCLILAQENLGFAAGNNEAIRQALRWKNCQALWLLNNDTKPDPYALDALCATVNQHEKAGICGSTIVYMEKPQCVVSTGGGYVNTWLGNVRHADEGKTLDWVKKRTNMPHINFIHGGSCLVQRSVFEKCGLLPEEYFLYYEDVAFCLTAQSAGFPLMWSKESIVLHKEGGSSGAKYNPPRRSDLVDFLNIRNRFYFLRRYFPKHLLLAPVALLAILFNRLRRKQFKRIPVALKAAWLGLQGKMGKPH